LLSFELQADLWFSENAEILAEDSAGRGVAALMGRLHGVKPFPAAARLLLQLAANPEHDRAELVRVVENDPGLAASVLRAINSSYFGLRKECTSIAHAVVLLGSRHIAEIASGLAVLYQFQGLGGEGKTVRDHSLVVATYCRRLAQIVPRLQRMDVFTCGLLHDLGKLLQLQVDDGPYAALLGKVGHRWEGLYAHERVAFGYDHAVLGAHVLRAWNLPPPLPRVVAWHHQPERAYAEDGLVGDLVALVRLADRLSYEVLLDAPEEELVDALVGDPGAERLGLGRNHFAQAWSDLSQYRE
jgi:putative nucleotidyltransferase with HDIG domain